MMVRGEDYEHAVDRNVAGKTYRMEQRARRPAAIPDVAATAALFSRRCGVGSGGRWRHVDTASRFHRRVPVPRQPGAQL